MTALLWLPEAVKNPHGRELSWAEKTDPKGCLHTTESSGWPDYQSWAVAPHATVMPKPNVGVEVRQHIPFDQASFSLRNLSGGVETNRDYVFQFELVGTCWAKGPGYRWDEADEAVLKDLYKKVIKPLSDAYGIHIKSPSWQAYDDSYGPRGNTNTVRMSGSTFDGYNGWLGHQHVPENVHGDPGAFPWTKMVQAVTPKPVPEDDMQIDDLIQLGPGQTSVLHDADGKISVGQALAISATSDFQLLSKVDKLIASVDALTEAVKAQQTP